MKIEGGCYCGEVRYCFDGEPGPAMQCHCRECQYITGGNPNVFVMISKSGLQFTQGELSSFQRTDIETAVTRHFCPKCGTAVGTTTPGAPGVFVMKVSTMDNADFFNLTWRFSPRTRRLFITSPTASQASRNCPPVFDLKTEPQAVMKRMLTPKRPFASTSPQSVQTLCRKGRGQR